MVVKVNQNDRRRFIAPLTVAHGPAIVKKNAARMLVGLGSPMNATTRAFLEAVQRPQDDRKEVTAFYPLGRSRQGLYLHCWWLPVIATAVAMMLGCRQPSQHVRPKAPAPRVGARAFQVVDYRDLLKGPGAMGEVGDFRLDNGRVAFIVAGIAHRLGYVETGGNLIDAATRTFDNDCLGLVFPLFDNLFTRQAIYTSARVVADGSRGSAGILRVTGHDSVDPKIRIATEYRLAAGNDYLEIVTTVSNDLPYKLDEYELGDVLLWRQAEPFILGWNNKDWGTNLTAPYAAAVGPSRFGMDRLTYGYAAEQELLRLHPGSVWTDATVCTKDIPPKGNATYRRFFYVVNGDIDALTTVLERDQRHGLGRPSWIDGRVRDATSGAGVANATIKCYNRAEYLLGQARSDQDGRYRIPVTGGLCHLVVSHRQRGACQPVVIEVAQQQHVKAEDIKLPAPARVVVRVVDQDGQPIPARLAFIGSGSTPSPNFGPAFAMPARSVVCRLPGRNAPLAVPPGTYRVVASRGLEYERAERTVTLRAGAFSQVELTIRRSVHLPGYISADFHQHGVGSFDTPLGTIPRIKANACEGVQLFAISDYNAISDYSPLVDQLRLSPWVRAVMAAEVTAFNWGRFSLLLVNPRPHLPRRGLPDIKGKNAAEILQALRNVPGALVQVNHPRAGYAGYFDRLRWVAPNRPPEAMSFNFDLLEVMSGRRMDEWRRVMHDWFHLLNRGLRITATGGSNSHVWLMEEPGYPRMYLLLDQDSPEQISEQAIRESLLNQRVFITSGPLVDFTVEGQPLGSTVAIKHSYVDIKVRVLAASWDDVSEVLIFANGKEALRIPVQGRANTDVVRFDKQLRLPISHDVWLVVLVKGARAIALPRGEPARKPLLPMALTNPIWVDQDGDGRYSPPAKP